MVSRRVDGSCIFFFLYFQRCEKEDRCEEGGRRYIDLSKLVSLVYSSPLSRYAIIGVGIIVYDL